MAKFIKFTNVTPLNLEGREQQATDEIILSTDQISSVSKSGDNYRLCTKSLVFKKEGDKITSFAPNIEQAIISKDDYENAKKILLEV